MRRLLAWAAVSAGAPVFLVLGASGVICLAIGEPAPSLKSVESASPERFRVAVLGDTQKGVTGLRRLIDRLRADTPELYVHTGDLVSTNDPGHYRLALWALARAHLDAPFVVVPGNHDVKGGPERFESHFGTREKDFARGRVRFVTVDDALGTPPAAADLERRIAGPAPVVLLMHVPPFDTKSDTFRPAPGFDDVVRLIRAHRVRYVLSGHAHTYRRAVDGDTVYIANGVGGDSESWQFDQKVYATLLEADGETLTDRAIELPPARDLRDELVHFALGHVAEAYRRRPILSWGATLALLAGWAWLIARLRARRGAA